MYVLECEMYRSISESEERADFFMNLASAENKMFSFPASLDDPPANMYVCQVHGRF